MTSIPITKREWVSIRAPAWGATFGTDGIRGKANVSIRAPAWGATRRAGGIGGAERFQFALPRGERHTEQCKY